MKTQITKTIKVAFLMLATLTIFSCSKKDDAPATASGESTMTWTLNGVNQSAKEFNCGIIPSNVFAGSLAMTGYTAENSRTSFFLSKEQAVVGTINIDAVTLGGVNLTLTGFYVGKNGGVDVDYDTTGGSITITEISATRAKGTFRLKVQNRANANEKIDITNGVFDVELTKQ